MPELVEQCPLCGSRKRSLFYQGVFKGRTVSNWLCNGCGLVFQSPRMTETEAEAFYQTEYRTLYQGDEKPMVRDLRVQRARAKTLLEFLRPWIQDCQRCLDIGASAGEWLLQLREAYSADVVGVEPGVAYRQYAQARGLQIYPTLSDVANEEASFDLISLLHVLEHLHDPVSYLRELRCTFLRPGGYLLVEVPNLYGHDAFEVAHNFAFSPYTLKQVLRKAGYRIVWMKTHGYPRSQIIPLYITVLATEDETDARPQIQKEHGVVWKRRCAMLSRRVLLRVLGERIWKGL